MAKPNWLLVPRGIGPDFSTGREKFGSERVRSGALRLPVLVPSSGIVISRTPRAELVCSMKPTDGMCALTSKGLGRRARRTRRPCSRAVRPLWSSWIAGRVGQRSTAWEGRRSNLSVAFSSRRFR
jgi:hypothetical protein